MSNTDFFDEDLVKPRSESALTSTVVIEETTRADDITGRVVQQDKVVSDLDLARMSRHRDQLEGQAAKTITEIERLKQRTDDLEHEKQQLSDLRKKQDSYVKSKREMMQRLNQSLLAIEKEEVKASQLVELYSNTRQSFRKMFGDIEGVDESQWPEDLMKDELSKAQDLVDSIRVECSKALVKLDTFASSEPAGGFSGPVSANSKHAGQTGQKHPFLYWLQVGLAISIPLAILVGGVGMLVFFAVTRWIP
jgi:hypothetical protein